MDNDIKLAIFDLDGTLVDSSEDVVECFNYAMKMEGLPEVAPGEIKHTIGYPLKGVFRRYGDPERLYEHFRKISEKIMGNRTCLLPGVNDTLAALRNNGMRIAMATTKIRQNTERILKILGIRQYFDELSCADDVEKVKPAPDALVRLLKITGLKAGQALMIGDTINDIIAARNAGVKSVAVLGGFDPIDVIREEKPDWIINNLSEVLEIISNGRKS